MLGLNSSIAWLVSNVVSNDHQELFDTELASSRLRAGVCIKGCLEEGFNVLPLNFREPSHRPELVYMAKYVPDSNTGKYLDDSGTRWQIWLDKVAALKGWGAKLVVDYTDNHFQNPNIVGDFYRTIQPSIDALVVPSTKMLGHLKGSWDGPVQIIPEPVEVSFMAPNASAEKKSQPLTALWFGHVTNLEYLFRFMATDLHKAPPRAAHYSYKQLAHGGCSTGRTKGAEGNQNSAGAVDFGFDGEGGAARALRINTQR
jgi:hypothetical protein